MNTLNNLLNAVKNPNFNGLGEAVLAFVVVVLVIFAVYATIDQIKHNKESKRLAQKSNARHAALRNGLRQYTVTNAASDDEAKVYLNGYDPEEAEEYLSKLELEVRLYNATQA